MAPGLPGQDASQQQRRKRLRSEEYTIAWYCPLALPELQASRLLLDEEHDPIPLPSSRRFLYTYGEMSGHNIVMATAPKDDMGISPAAHITSEMLAFHPRLKFCLLVGIGGGVPRPEKQDVRLGDVVVGVPNREQQHGGVVQYDYGKVMHDNIFQRIGALNRPDTTLLSAVSEIQSRGVSKTSFYSYVHFYETLEDDEDREYSFSRPGTDALYPPDLTHRGCGSCEQSGCDRNIAVQRKARQRQLPRLHYGTIASGNSVMKDAQKRDRLAEEIEGLLCFEMEAAGIANAIPYMAVRGICDYCDSHKNNIWQPYAAAVAAAFAKTLLSVIPTEEVQSKKDMSESITTATLPSDDKPTAEAFALVDNLRSHGQDKTTEMDTDTTLQDKNVVDEDQPMEKDRQDSKRIRSGGGVFVKHRRRWIWGLVIVTLAIVGIATGVSLSQRSSKNQSSPNDNSDSTSGSSTSANEPGHNSQAAAIRIEKGSGYSMVTPDDGSTFYAYFQDTHGNIIEAFYPNASMKSARRATIATAGDPASASLITAAAWRDTSGEEHRIVFFSDSTGQILTANVTADKPWSQPYALLPDDLIASGSIAMAVCLDLSSPYLIGIHLYYASTKGTIQEVGTSFNASAGETNWQLWKAFNGSDVRSGVGCTIENESINVYLVDNGISGVQLWQWNADGGHTWKRAALGSAVDNKPYTDIAALLDTDGDRVFFQASDGTIQQVFFSSDDGTVSQGQGFQEAADGTRLAAVQTDDGDVLLLFEDDEAAMGIAVARVGRDGRDIEVEVLR